MTHNWEYKPVSEIFDTVTDFVAAGSFADLRENVIYNNEQDFAQLIRTTDLKNNFSNSQFVYVNEHAFNYLWRVNLAEECIILPNIGNCGEVYYLHPSMLIYPNNVLGPNAIMVRSKKHNQKYLAFALKGKYFQRQLFQIVSQVAQSKFNKTNLKKLIVPVPSLEVQEQIVAELDKINETIEDCRELLRNLDALAQSLFYDFFGDPITNPYNFPKSKLDQLCNIVGRIGFRGYTRNDLVEAGQGAITLSPTNIVNGVVTYDKNTYISWDKYDESPEIMIFDGDVLLTKTGSTVGKIGIVKTLPEKATINPQLVVLKNLKLNNWYITFTLRNDAYQEIIREKSGGSAVPTISQKILGTISLSVPPLELQEKFAERIEQIEAQKEAVESTIAELQTLLDSRMDYWFN